MKPSPPRPPRLGYFLMRLFLGRGEHYSMVGDFDELYAETAAARGRRAAGAWYMGQVARLIPPSIIHTIRWSLHMFGSYLRTGFRNIKRHKGTAFINVFGLSIGMAGAILILLYVVDEMSFDRFHAQKDSIYRVLQTFLDGDGGAARNWGPSMPAGAAPLIQSFFRDDIEHVILFARDQVTIRTGSAAYHEEITFTDPAVFSVFSFPLLRGDPATALARDTDIVLTRTAAARYFGSRSPMGETLTVLFGSNKKDFVVTGVAADPPGPSTIKFSFLIRTENLTVGGYKEALTTLGDFSYPIFIKLRRGSGPERITSRFNAFLGQAYGAEFEQWGDSGTKRKGYPIALDLQPLAKIHFDTSASDGTDPSSVIILAGIALIILLIACINFINLAMGRAAVRGGEIGLRKVIGAQRRQIRNQFLSESLVLVTSALMAGVFLSLLFLPTFNRLSQKNLGPADLFRPLHLLGLAALLVVVAVLSGGYPAWMMSRIQPAQAFKGKLAIGSRRGLTKILVVIQFALSVFLIISTFVLGSQVRFLIAKDPGFDKAGLLSLPLGTSNAEQVEPIVGRLREKLRSMPQVTDVSATSVPLGHGWSRGPLKQGGVEIPMYQFRVDPYYVRTMGLRLVQGRDFRPDGAADTESAIVNREFCRRLGIADPIGRRVGEFAEGKMSDYPNKLTIIGVIENFNNLSFREGIVPVLFHRQPGWGMRTVIIRIRESEISRTLKDLEAAWKEIQTDNPFSFTFVDDDLASQYASERRWSGIVRYSTIFAALIASMGILGLTALAVQRRFKEIGVRKVLGASAGRVFALLTREMLGLVAVANLAAGPAAYFVMRNVLNRYYYRIAIGPSFFLTAAGLSLLVSLATISYLALRAALSDPVEAIRWE
jgi:putative ABC transport system permease protein